MLGCLDCVTKYPNAATCDNVSALSCLKSHVLLSQFCVNCTAPSLQGFKLNSQGECEEICGDGINYFGACDDGNTLDGDGCSKTCTVEAEWECTNTNPQTPSSCKVVGNLTVEIIGYRKTPGKNEIFVTISTSIPLRLSKSNVALSLTDDALIDYSMTTISLTQYEFKITYRSTIQNTLLTLSFNTAHSRLLEETRLLQSSVLNFNLPIQAYPPAVFYPDTTANLFNGISLFLNIVCGITLGLAVLGFVGVKRTVFHSMELFNLMVLIYILEGIGLVNYSDWIAYSIAGMARYTLIGGFSLGLCNCFADVQQYTYGYADQLFENAGIVMALDAFVLVLLGLIYSMFRIKNDGPEIKKEVSWVDIAWIFGKYYALAFCLVFNLNVLFSSFLTIYHASVSTPVAEANIAFALIVLIFSVAFLVVLCLWTKQLSTAAVHPKPAENTSQVSKHLDGSEAFDQLDRSSMAIQLKHRHSQSPQRK